MGCMRYIGACAGKMFLVGLVHIIDFYPSKRNECPQNASDRSCQTTERLVQDVLTGAEITIGGKYSRRHLRTRMYLAPERE